MPTRVVRIATSADSPPRLQGEVVELDRFSAKVALETREATLREGTNVWLHFDSPDGASSLSVAGIVSGVAPGGRITVLLSLSPREYSRLQGLPEPPVQRGRRAVQPSALMPPSIKPIPKKREAPEPRPVPESPRPAQPTETPSLAPSAVEPDIASLSPIERAKALAAAMAELVGPSVETAPERPSASAAAPVEIVAPPPEPVSPTPVEPVEAPAAAEPTAEVTWLKPAESTEVPVEVVEPPPEAASVSSAEAMEIVAPPPEPVSPTPVEPAVAQPPAVKPNVIRMSLIARTKALATALAEMIAPSAEPASARPSQPVEAPVPAIAPSPEPVEMVAPPPEPVSPSPVEVVEPAAEVEPAVEPEWLGPAEVDEAAADAVEAPAELAEAPVAMVAPPPEPVSVSPAEQAEALAARGELEGAWKVYYDALRVTPEDLRLWYGLGLTLSRLDRRKETEEIFQYVMSRGDPDSEEVKHARRWLASAGALAEPAAPAVPAAPRSETARWATVKGRVTWSEPELPREVFLVLQGLDEGGSRSLARVPLGQFYEFDGLPPGLYRLIGGVETEWLWDFRFTIQAGEETVLDLSRRNSTSPAAQV